MTQPYKPTADELLSGGGGPKSITLKNIGDSITGTVVDTDSIHKQKFGTDEKEYYPDGKPVWQVVLTLQTAWRNWEGVAENLRPDTADDGLRRVFCSQALKSELAKAVKATGKPLQLGSTLTITFAREVPTKGFPRKEYTVSLQLPVDNVLAEAAPAQPPAAQPVAQAPVVQQAPAVAQPAQVQAGQQLTPELLALLQAQMQQQQ